MNLSCYILDDEQFSVDYLASFIEKTPGLRLAGTSNDPLQALEDLTGEIRADLTFADIHMPQMNGLDFAGIARFYSTIVFTTAHKDYAFEAYQQNAVDYLLKPFTYERFCACVMKANKYILNPAAEGRSGPGCFYITTGIKGKYLKIETRDIYYTEGALNYIKIHLQNQSYLTYHSLADMDKFLSGQTFLRIHKSFIVNIEKIRSIEKGQVTLQNGVQLNIGRNYRDTVQQYIRDRSLDDLKNGKNS